MPAAKASMAAHQQGKFWQYHDLLFANQKSMTDANILKWAKDLSLDMAKFKKDMADPELEKEILRQQAAMVALGARGTPAFFLNGKKMAGAKPFTEFQKEIDAELVKINQRIAGGANLNAARTASMQSAENGANFIKWVIQGQEPPGVKAPAKPTAKKTPPKPKKPIADEVVWRATIHPDDARKGGKQPLVTLVEFSDFQ